jgi:hypothetical protein
MAIGIGQLNVSQQGDVGGLRFGNSDGGESGKPGIRCLGTCYLFEPSSVSSVAVNILKSCYRGLSCKRCGPKVPPDVLSRVLR